MFCHVSNCLFCWMQYESTLRQEAARNTVPVDELEEKALVSLAKVHLNFFNDF